MTVTLLWSLQATIVPCPIVIHRRLLLIHHPRFSRMRDVTSTGARKRILLLVLLVVVLAAVVIIIVISVTGTDARMGIRLTSLHLTLRLRLRVVIALFRPRPVADRFERRPRIPFVAAGIPTNE